MQVITDIEPVAGNCPDPHTSWAHWKPRGAYEHLMRECFPSGRELYLADEDGRKMSREFPLVVWRGHSPESQMEVASRLADRLPPGVDRLVLVAGGGSLFRGHYDRRWAAVPGNLHVTVLMRETAPHEHVGLAYAILPVLALCDCAAGLVTSQRSVRVKWINDILLNGAKIGGALSRGRTSGRIFTHAVFGMGLNVAAAPDVAPTVFVPSVSCLGPHAGGRSLLEILKHLLSSFASNNSLLVRKGLGGLAPRYRKVSDVIGREVRLYEDGPGLDDTRVAERRVLARGVVEGITDELQLVINGRPHGSGRLAYEEDCRAFGLA